MTPPDWMLVSDLDGTLLGDDASLRDFSRWIDAKRERALVVYATGRTFSSVASLCAEGTLPKPDYVISLVGTEIHSFADGKPYGDWCAPPPKSWSVEAVREVASTIADAEFQSEEFQSPLKVSLFLEQASKERLEAIRALLYSHLLECELVYSGERYLDFLPLGVDKGAAAWSLAKSRGIERESIVACGDSENDLSLFTRGFRGVLVANAHRNLFKMRLHGVYQSPYPFAAGVRDGCEYWRKQDRAANQPSS